jgi:ElaB/YqjD/DUF883 family membrane-anchored ribosome-binding protein
MTDILTSVSADHSPLTGTPDITTSAQTAVGDIVTKAKDKAQSFAQGAADAVDQNRGSAAHVLANAASTIRDSATHLPGGDGVTRLAKAAADEIDTTAQYVREHDTQQMFVDLKRFVTRHPVASLVGAAAMGVLVGRGFRKR